MPPKKKQRIASTTPTVSTPLQDPEPSTPKDSTGPPPQDESTLLTDAWTDAQETALFKALIRHKPTGIHKHFHMLSIAANLPTTPHTRIPSIWTKLSTLYDLEALDEREENFAARPPGSESGDDEEDENEDEVNIERQWTREFSLEGGDAEFWQMMMARRLASDGGSSPPDIPALLDRDSVVSASPAPSKRGGRRPGLRGGASSTRGLSKRSIGPGRRIVRGDDASPDDEEEEEAEEDGEEETGEPSTAASSPRGRATRRRGHATSVTEEPATRGGRGGRGGRKKQA